MTIGEKIRKLRLSNGYGQAELARKAGMTPQQLCNIEKGRRPRVAFVTVQKLAKALNVGAVYLLN